MYYKGLMLLEFLYDNGMTHGHINANSLRISDDYTFILGDFPISTVTPNYTTLSVEEQESAKVQPRGFHKKTVSDHLRTRISNLISSSRMSEGRG